jgi:hypothetical protein
MGSIFKLHVCWGSEKGMTLPEFILGIAIASVVTAVSAQIVSNQSASQTLYEARAEISDITRDIRSVLANTEACKRSIAGFAPGSDIPRIYRVSRDHSLPGSPWQETVSHVAEPDSTKKVRIKSFTLQGALPANNNGVIRLVVRYEVNRNVIGVREYERDMNLRAYTDSTGTIVSCSGLEGDKSTRLLCSDPIAACADHPNYCREQVYVNQAQGCLCLGSRTVGKNIFGIPCDGIFPSPSPSPTPSPSPSVTPSASPSATPSVTPSGSPSPAATPSGSPSPGPSTSPGFLVDSQSLHNGDNSIFYRIKLKEAGRVHYAIFSEDKGVLTSAQVRTFGMTAPSGTLAAAGTQVIADPTVLASITVAGLPDSKFYTFYSVAETTAGILDQVKKYESVIPRRLSIQEIPAVPAPIMIRYYLYYPIGHYDAALPNPVLIYQHGDGENIADPMNSLASFTSGTQRMQKASVPAHLLQGRELPFILIAPQCNSDAMSCLYYMGANAVGYIDAVIATAKSALKADVKRIYMTGISTGGTAAWKFAMRAGSSLAAIIPFSTGTLATDSMDFCGGIAANNVAVWAFHNANDVLVEKNRTESFVAQLTACGGSIPPRMTIYSGTNWPASADLSKSTWSESAAHDSLSYSLGTPYYNYIAEQQVPMATPLEPQLVSELNAVGVSVGKPVKSLWDWLLLHKKP